MADNWITITESQYPWEREALEYVKSRFPAHEPYRAWSNFEFIAHDGSINEVDLLVFSRVGFFLVEIKSKPGILSGDSGTWTWETDGRRSYMDNPYAAANLKSKKLTSLLKSQRAAKGKLQVPWLDAIVFLSAEDLKCELTGSARTHVTLRDREAGPEVKARDGIMATVTRRKCPGLDTNLRGEFNKPVSKMIAQAMLQAQIRPSQRYRKVGDYKLSEIIGEGQGYQDWDASHVQLANSKRRIRIYNLRSNASEDERETLQRAAKREAELLEGLQHPGVLRREGYTMHELGPALIFEHNPAAIRLDHYIKQQHEQLTDEQRCRLLRQIAETVRFAHEKQTYHRGLCPQSILVDHSNRLSSVKVFNWQLGFRHSPNTDRHSRIVTATSHIDRLIDEASTAYLAPEAGSSDHASGEKLDVFSLGAIAFHLFSGETPAANGIELAEKLRGSDGLQIRSVRPAVDQLHDLIEWSTNPVVGSRVLDSVEEFLEMLVAVEKEMVKVEQSFVEDPAEAKPGDVIAGEYLIHRRIGHGATSYAFLVQKEDDYFIAKIASDEEHNSRLKEESEVLSKLRHANIAEFVGNVSVGDRHAIIIKPAIANKEKLSIETLRHRLKEDGALHVDLLQRFGDDLLNAVSFIEDQGYNHRDIKPDNVAVGQVGSGDRLHLVLFDFSLTRVRADNLQAGTPGYLDPMLPLRKNKQWDSYAERYAAAVTLYQMATGLNNFPNWSEDGTDPTQLESEAEIDAELFAANLRESLIDFFEKAFARKIETRHDNAEQMRRDWNDCFRDLEEPGEFLSELGEDELKEKLESATLATAITDLGLGTRAVNALDRNDITTVEQLLSAGRGRIHRLKGIGHTTRRHINRVLVQLQHHLQKPVTVHEAQEETDLQPETNVERLSIDQLFKRVSGVGRQQGEKARAILPLVFGTDPDFDKGWAGSAEIAKHVKEDRQQIVNWIKAFRDRWAKDAAITKLRKDIHELLESVGQVMGARDIASALLVTRGSHQLDPFRSQYALAVTRVAVEVERNLAKPKFLARRTSAGSVIVASRDELISVAAKLGAGADQLAANETIVSPARAIKALRSINEELTTHISDSNLVRLASSISQIAALSSRNEFYPKGMSAERAIKLSQNVLYGSDTLSVADLKSRVKSRYPFCADIPDPPQLNDILKNAGFDYRWNSSTATYENPALDQAIHTSGTNTLSRNSTSLSSGGPREVTPEVADARQFEERIEHALKQGALLALNVKSHYYDDAIGEITRRWDVELFDLEENFIRLLREKSHEAEVPWPQLLEVDAQPGQGHWNNLLILIDRVVEDLKKQVLESEKTVLMTFTGILDHYQRKQPFIADLAERIHKELHGLWILLPDQEHVPTTTASGQAPIPKGWLQNLHRGVTI